MVQTSMQDEFAQQMQEHQNSQAPRGCLPHRNKMSPSKHNKNVFHMFNNKEILFRISLLLELFVSLFNFNKINQTIPPLPQQAVHTSNKRSYPPSNAPYPSDYLTPPHTHVMGKATPFTCLH
jgi:hypothetical protein